MSQLMLQPFCRFTYVTAHSPSLPLLHLRHSSFSNPSFASPTSQALHLRHLASRPCYFRRCFVQEAKLLGKCHIRFTTLNKGHVQYKGNPKAVFKGFRAFCCCKALAYALDGPGSTPGLGEGGDFSSLLPGVHLAFCKMSTGSVSRGEGDRVKD